MPTKYRTLCESNIYHITARGVAQQIIFEDDDDRRFFGKRLRECLEQNEAELYAWCFMSNHVHLLIHAEMKVVTAIMRSLLGSYAMYFNRRHGRTGHLFQNRFDSVAIETDEQFMTTLRYIHRNPSEASDKLPENHEWSSYREYLGKPFITNTQFAQQFFHDRDAFIVFHESWETANVNEHDRTRNRKALSDEEAIQFAKELLGIESLSVIATLDKSTRNAYLAKLKEGDLPIAQIARITGIGRNIVQRAK